MKLFWGLRAPQLAGIRAAPGTHGQHNHYHRYSTGATGLPWKVPGSCCAPACASSPCVHAHGDDESRLQTETAQSKLENTRKHMTSTIFCIYKQLLCSALIQWHTKNISAWPVTCSLSSLASPQSVTNWHHCCQPWEWGQGPEQAGKTPVGSTWAGCATALILWERSTLSGGYWSQHTT